jgi:hypothetical protein
MSVDVSVEESIDTSSQLMSCVGAMVVPCHQCDARRVLLVSRFLYEEFMSRSSTRASLASGNFMSMMNVLMQLRKVR